MERAESSREEESITKLSYAAVLGAPIGRDNKGRHLGIVKPFGQTRKSLCVPQPQFD